MEARAGFQSVAVLQGSLELLAQFVHLAGQGIVDGVVIDQSRGQDVAGILFGSNLQHARGAQQRLELGFSLVGFVQIPGVGFGDLLQCLAVESGPPLREAHQVAKQSLQPKVGWFGFVAVLCRRLPLVLAVPGGFP